MIASTCFTSGSSSPLRVTATNGPFGLFDSRTSFSPSPAGIQTMRPGSPLMCVAMNSTAAGLMLPSARLSTKPP